jgi:hypothetical protein
MEATTQANMFAPSLVWWENLWKYTETCDNSNYDSSSRVSHLSIRDFVMEISSSDTSVSPTISYGKSVVSSLLTTSWYIIDSATNPFCDGTSGSLNITLLHAFCFYIEQYRAHLGGSHCFVSFDQTQLLSSSCN